MIEHYKTYSFIRDGIEIHLSLSRFEKQFQQAQEWLDNQVWTDMQPYMALAFGDLIQQTGAKNASIKGDGLVYAAVGPYGRFQYMGKTMVDVKTGSPWARSKSQKVLVKDFAGVTHARENLIYSRPSAKPLYFDIAKKNKLKQWVKGTRKIAGGK